MSGRIYTSLFILFVTILATFVFVRRQEGFIGDPNAQRCGVDQPPCPFGTACLNGWCVGTNPPQLPESTGLPVLPSGKQF